MAKIAMALMIGIAAATSIIVFQMSTQAHGQIITANSTIPQLKTHLDKQGGLVFDNATAAEMYLAHQDIKQQKQAVKNACIFHNVTAILMCPPLQLSLSNKTTQP